MWLPIFKSGSSDRGFKNTEIKLDADSINADAGIVRKAPANARPIEGHVLLVDGKFKTQVQTAEDAMAAGMTLRKKIPFVQVHIYDAVERSFAPVEVAERAVKPPGE